MHSITEVFRASASSVYDTFNLKMGVSSFRVPVYQRQYTWTERNITRLFEDINDGLVALGSEEDYLTFLGTIVLVDENDKKEQYFDGYSLSVVDGQQRLTTLALICCALFVELDKEAHLDLPDHPFASAIKEETRALCDSLFGCAVGHPSSHRPLERHDYFPRIVREEIDIRSAAAQEAKYASPIANHLFQFSDHVRSNRLSDFRAESSQTDGSDFRTRMNTIVKLVNLVGDEDGGGESSAAFPATLELLEKKKYRSVLFPKLQQRTSQIYDVLEHVQTSDNGELRTLVRLVCFGNYLMQRVAITHVIAGDERYAFDIFEALNSTGEPLTAIETFKPNVIRFENLHPPKYERSPARQSLDIVESHVRRFDKYEDQQSESRELVVLLALYMSGKRLGLQLNSQRRYLRTTYERLAGIAARRRFVRALADVAGYRSRFWEADEISYQLRTGEEKEVALFCLEFLRGLRNSLTIPILCRYWIKSERDNDTTGFVSAVKAVTAFLVLRRAATGGTRAIDSDYRRLMSHGGATEADGLRPLMMGEREEAEVLDLGELKKYLRGYLRQPKVGISNRDEWVRRVSHQPLYKSGPALLCRFMLLVAAHNSVQDPGNRFLLKRGRPNPDRDYINLRSWKREDFSTVEHVAPQGRREGWDGGLYSDHNLVDYLGNLSLLPEKMNVSIGNKPWSKKALFYRAAAAETNNEVRECIENARDQGLDFGSKIVTMLETGGCLPILSSVSAADDWDATVVQMRTKNIAELVWDEMSIWLGWKEELTH